MLSYIICRISLGWHLSAIYYLWRFFLSLRYFLRCIAKRVQLLVRSIRALQAAGVMSAVVLATTFFFCAAAKKLELRRVEVAFRRYDIVCDVL